MLPFFRRRKSLLTMLVMAAIIIIGWVLYLRERSIAEAIGLAMQIR